MIKTFIFSLFMAIFTNIIKYLWLAAKQEAETLLDGLFYFILFFKFTTCLEKCWKNVILQNNKSWFLSIEQYFLA